MPYFVFDATKADENIFATGCMTIEIKHMGISNDFLCEK